MSDARSAFFATGEAPQQEDLRAKFFAGELPVANNAKVEKPGYVESYTKGVKEAASGFGKEVSDHPIKSMAMAIPAAAETLASMVGIGVADASAVLHSAIDKIPGSDKLGFDPKATFAQRKSEYEKGIGAITNPQSDLGKSMEQVTGAGLKPIGDVLSLPGKAVGRIAGAAGASPETRQSLEEQTNAVTNIAALRAGVRPGEKPSATIKEPVKPVEQAKTVEPKAVEKPSEKAPFEDVPLTFTERPKAAAVKEVDSPPVEGGVPKEQLADRAAILNRVGIGKVRQSILAGDAATAARDLQVSRFDEPAGHAAKAEFDGYRQALEKHAEGIVGETGGSIGMSEDAVHSRGQSIAEPFDKFREYFDKQKQAFYDEADARTQGLPAVKTESLDNLLVDRSFKNRLTATNQMNVLEGVKGELEAFKETNPGGITVKNAEQFRQFLNSIWTRDNSSIIGRLKGALDEDVFRSAGDDVYKKARDVHALEKATLDNPKGIAKLMEFDPNTPVNRVTAYEKIPDTISRLSVGQFDNMLDTLKKMPEELQPQAKAAIAEIKAHLANKVYQAGSKTKGQWDDRAVSKVISDNKAKFRSVFADQPEILQKIADLESAGKILKVDGSYPGAAAQAANALKRGLMSNAVESVSTAAGGGMGGWVGGPIGAMGGAAVGRAMGAKVGANMGEKAALKKWEAGQSIPLSEVLKKK